MITRQEERAACDWAWHTARQAGLVLHEDEARKIAVADFGLGRLKTVGAQILTLEANDWLSVKVIILSPWQLLPQHRHPPCPNEQYPGKTELLRGQWGTLYHYSEGESTADPRARASQDDRAYLTVWHETIFQPATQLVIPPNTWHWLQAGAEGAVVWSISSKATDAADQFADPRIVRQTQFAE